MDEHEESEIASGLRAGDADAWRRLYDAQASRVWCLVARAVGRNSAEVGDVVQEVFLAAARSARGFNPARGSLTAWLNGIARRQIALHFRRKRRGPKVSAASTEDDLESAATVNNTPDPGAAAAAAELAEQVRFALNGLPAEYEVLLTTKYLDGASLEQIAAAEQTTVEAVRSKLARARRAFRRIVERWFPDLCEDSLRVHDAT